MRPLLLLLFVFCVFQGKSQQNRFAFFQAAANEPFYIRMEDKTFSSTSFGYLVLSKLKDSTYKLYIGLPKNKSSEQEFNVPISGSDRGFEIKKAADGSIRLYDWQKMNFIEPLARPEKPAEGPTQAKTDKYSTLMAGVVNDPAVATITVSLPAETISPQAEVVGVTPKPVNEQPDFTSDTSVLVVKQAEKSIDSPKLDTVRPVKQEGSVPVNTGSNSSTTQSAVIVPVTAVISQTGKDTVEMVGSKEKDTVQSTTNKDSVSPKVQMSTAIISLSDTSKDGYRELVFLDRDTITIDTIIIRIPLEVDSIIPVDTALYRIPKDNIDTSTKTTTVQLINSDCTNMASEGDVDKLRVLILNANSNDLKVAEAKKVFRTRCFTTRQIRALSELFSSDDGRYKFFDAAYPFVSDSGNFKSLIDLLEDSFYINRFKTLARIQD